MTLAATRRFGLAFSGVIGVVAAVLAVALIAAVSGNPERVVVAMNDGEFSSILSLVIDRLASMAGTVLRLIL